MSPKTLPKKYQEIWASFPTLDELRAQNPELKQHQIRAVLVNVTCFRCPDKSVRYLPEDVTKALLQAGEVEADDDEMDELLTPPKAYDAMILFRECLKMVSETRRDRNDTIKAMETPLLKGIEMMISATKVLEGRLLAYDKVWDRMLITTEKLVSNQAEREMEEQRNRDKQELKKHALSAVTEYLPDLASKFVPNTTASLALDAFNSLEPELIEGFMKSGALSPSQSQLFGRLWDAVKGKKRPTDKAPEQDTNHAAA